MSDANVTHSLVNKLQDEIWFTDFIQSPLGSKIGGFLNITMENTYCEIFQATTPVQINVRCSSQLDLPLSLSWQVYICIITEDFIYWATWDSILPRWGWQIFLAVPRAWWWWKDKEHVQISLGAHLIKRNLGLLWFYIRLIGQAIASSIINFLL